MRSAMRHQGHNEEHIQEKNTSAREVRACGLRGIQEDRTDDESLEDVGAVEIILLSDVRLIRYEITYNKTRPVFSLLPMRIWARLCMTILTCWGMLRR